MRVLPTLVIGGGPAGLATSYELGRRNVRHLVLERGDRPGWCWTNLYDSLTLHTGKHLSSLPGMKFPRSAPMFVSREYFCDYLERYARTFALPLRTGHEVRRVETDNGNWLVHTPEGELRAAVLVVATGIISNPVIPQLPGRERFRGRIMHSIEYRRPAGYRGRRVLVVGVGNSGAEIGSELARAGARVTMAVRSGANVVPLTLFGLPIQYSAYVVRQLPRAAQDVITDAVRRVTEWRRGPPVLPRPGYGPLDAIPLIGFHLVDAIRAGLVNVRGGIEELTERGARFTSGEEEEFDQIILATGFRSALDMLGDLIRVDSRGFAVRTDRVTSADNPNLFFVGQNYDATGGLMNIRRDSALTADKIAAKAVP